MPSRATRGVKIWWNLNEKSLVGAGKFNEVWKVIKFLTNRTTIKGEKEGTETSSSMRDSNITRVSTLCTPGGRGKAGE